MNEPRLRDSRASRWKVVTMPSTSHDKRVATRRLRAALRTFDHALPDDPTLANAELCWLGRGLATGRDGPQDVAGQSRLAFRRANTLTLPSERQE